MPIKSFQHFVLCRESLLRVLRDDKMICSGPATPRLLKKYRREDICGIHKKNNSDTKQTTKIDSRNIMYSETNMGRKWEGNTHPYIPNSKVTVRSQENSRRRRNTRKSISAENSRCMMLQQISMRYIATLKPFIQNVHAVHMQSRHRYRRKMWTLNPNTKSCLARGLARWVRTQIVILMNHSGVSLLLNAAVNMIVITVIIFIFWEWLIT